MRRLPYPHGVLYTVTIVRESARTPGFRRSWSRFSFDATYAGGLAASARLGTLRLRPGSYLVSSSARPITDASAGRLTLGRPRDRCSKQIEIRAAERLRIDVFAASGQPCRIRVAPR